MKLKPWYNVVTPRKDLCEDRPLDAGEFAVHLDKVRDGSAKDDYSKPDQFFAKTFLATNLLKLSAQVVRRLNGETAQTSAVYNLATQFGGGKTHALTLLYHLAKGGPASKAWTGVGQILSEAQVSQVPQAEVAVFVGTEFDAVTGRGGDDGTPRRMTPWGELAWQLGGASAFAHMAEHDAKGIAPGGDVIKKILPAGKPCMILLDEMMNYVSRFRKSGLGDQLFNFMFNLSGAINDTSVLVVSIPKSEDEMTTEDVADYQRLTKMIDRVGKSMPMTAGAETSEIIRRRLFEWDAEKVGQSGRVLLDNDATQTCTAYAQWLLANESQLGGTLPAAQALDAFKATYPFHPSVLSVFERKWQTVPSFQRTRGVLKMLAIWVAKAYSGSYRKLHKDALIGLGTAPLDDAIFRSEVFEQLGNRALEGAVTTDISGQSNSHADRLDAEAVESIREARLHRKAATTIFFESNGGAARAEASVPEIRLAIGEPNLDIGNVETALDALTDACYYLTVERKTYRFSVRENLNKRYSDRRSMIGAAQVDESVRGEIEKVFKSRPDLERVFFPKDTAAVSDRATLSVAITGLQQTMEEEKPTLAFIEQVMRECGTTGRTYKSGVLCMVAESAQPMRDEAKKVLAWQSIYDEAHELKLDDAQRSQVKQNVDRAQRDLREAVWRGYRYVLLLGKDSKLKRLDLGLVHSSAADSPLTNVINRLIADDELTKAPSPNLLLRYWPPTFSEWSTKAVRDAFYASPLLPRVLGADALKDTISKGVSDGRLAYASKNADGTYGDFVFGRDLSGLEVEFSEGVVLLRKDDAEKYLASKAQTAAPMTSTTAVPAVTTEPAATTSPTPASTPAPSATTPGAQGELFRNIEWSGEVPPQKWMNFYTKVVSKFGVGQGLKLTVRLEAAPDGGISPQKLEEAKNALRELGLDPDVTAS
jgi:hypothetical protein